MLQRKLSNWKWIYACASLILLKTSVPTRVVKAISAGWKAWPCTLNWPLREREWERKFRQADRRGRGQALLGCTSGWCKQHRLPKAEIQMSDWILLVAINELKGYLKWTVINSSCAWARMGECSVMVAIFDCMVIVREPRVLHEGIICSSLSLFPVRTFPVEKGAARQSFVLQKHIQNPQWAH